MRKLSLLLFVLAAIGYGQKANAQSNSVVSDDITVTIDLTTPVLSINLGSTEVEFDYLTVADYNHISGKVVSMPAHFTVVSNRKFNVDVKAKGPFEASGTGTLALDVVEVELAASTTIGGTNEGYKPLAETDARLLSDATASNNAVFDVNYRIPDSAPLILAAPEVYTTDIVYTVTQD